VKVEKEITIVDLAQKLNVSTSTISRALTGHPSISIRTRQRVLGTAKKLEYRSNNLARSLRQQKANTISVIVHEMSSHFIISVLV
jgi:LacI family transcriptional regulator